MTETEMTPWGTERAVTETSRVGSIPSTGPKPWEGVGFVPCSDEELARIEKEYEAKQG